MKSARGNSFTSKLSNLTINRRLRAQVYVAFCYEDCSDELINLIPAVDFRYSPETPSSPSRRLASYQRELMSNFLLRTAKLWNDPSSAVFPVHQEKEFIKKRAHFLLKGRQRRSDFHDGRTCPWATVIYANCQKSHIK
ncbi:hypothetical protein EVAR_5363_1 [Eumeta japonica]|uniref:Uncharacterized protein n=1 Tax=Eumeta variegata TaxID=151549 RepID=A0A4C1TNZ6_EUMVA|nr:hypothetical protein EVAR_5363_1 [Eumeta japonica]